MDATYSCLEAVSLIGKSTSWDVSTRTVIQSGDTYVQSSMDSKTLAIASLKFEATANSDNLHVTFNFSFQNMQSASNRAWFVGIAETELTNVRPSQDSLIGYQTFASNSSYATTKTLSFTFNGSFESGKTYYLVVGMTTTSYNRGSIVNVNGVDLTAVNVSVGDEAYICENGEYTPYDVFAFINGEWVPYDPRLHDGTDWGS